MDLDHIQVPQEGDRGGQISGGRKGEEVHRSLKIVTISGAIEIDPEIEGRGGGRVCMEYGLREILR